MILYHGSNTAIEQIDLEKSKPNKDFGRGFYLSELEEQALEMASFKVMTLGGEEIVTKFEFDESIMFEGQLRIKVFKEYSEEWADFVFANRDGLEVETYDIVYGPIANDRVGVQIRRFQDKAIDIDQFVAALQYMRGITFQYAFCTDKAIQTLQRL